MCQSDPARLVIPFSSLTSRQAPLCLSSSASFLREQQPETTRLLVARQRGPSYLQSHLQTLSGSVCP